MRISDWSSDVCSSDLFSDMNLRTVEAAQIIVPISGFINIVGKDQRRITAFGRHLRFDNQRFIRRQFVSALIIELTHQRARSEEHTSELQSLMRISYAVFCLKKKK